MKNKFTKKHKNVLIINGTQGMASLSLAVVYALHTVAKVALRAVCRAFIFTVNSLRNGSTPRARKLSRFGGYSVHNNGQLEIQAGSAPRARKLSLLGSQFMAVLLIAGTLLPFASAFIPSNPLIDRVPFAPAQVQAQTPANTLNFQGRLLTNTGALVPDGNYHIEFKLYDSELAGASAQGVCVGGGTDDCLWVETRTTGNLVTVQNGYYSVYLGDVTALPAIDWSQELYLTMNIGGTGGAASWDGEMTPRFRLTAVPYAFRAANVASGDTSTATTDSADVTIQTGDASGATSDSGDITIDVGTATQTTGAITLGATNASGITIGNSAATLALQGSASSNIVVTNGGNSTTLNFANPTGTNTVTIPDGSGTLLIDPLTTQGDLLYHDGSGSTRLAIGGASTCLRSDGTDASWGSCSGTGDVLQNGNSFGATMVIGTNDAQSLQLEVGGVAAVTIADEGATTFQNETDSTAAFDIQNAAGTSLFSVDTTNSGGATFFTGSGEISAFVTETDTLPAVRHYGASIAHNGYLYTVGGEFANDSDGVSTVYYSPINNDGSIDAWSTTTALPLDRFYHTVEIVNGYMYVIGGNETSSFTPQSTVYYAKINSDGTVGTWNTTTALPSARSGHSSVSANGYIYVFGGYSSSAGTSAQTTTYYASVNPDGTLSSWTAGTALPSARALAKSVVNNDYVYVISGDNTTPSRTDTVYYASINPSTGAIGSWTLETDTLPEVLRASAAVVSNGTLYTIGGADSSLASINEVYYSSLSSDGSTGSWSTSSETIPAVRRAHMSAIYGSTVYVIGGYNSASEDTVYYAQAGSTLTVNGNANINGSVTANSGQVLGSFQVGGASSFGDDVSVLGLLQAESGYFDGNLTVGGSAITFSNATYQNCGGLSTDGSGLVVCGTGEGTNEFSAVVGTSSATGGNASDNVATADYTADGNTGSAGDGDQVQINSAIDAVSAAGGGTVFLLEGTYIVDGTIDLDEGVQIVGSGTGATIIQLEGSHDANLDIFSEDSDPTHWSIRDLSIDVNASSQASGNYAGISINNAGSVTGSGGLIDNVEVYDFSGENDVAIYAYYGYNLKITNSSFYDGDTPIFITGGGAFFPSNVTISDNTFTDFDDAGIRVDDTSEINIDGNFLQAADETGTTNNAVIAVEGSYHVNITGNVIIGLDSVGIGTDLNGGAERVTITGNKIIDSAYAAISGSYTDSVISGNEISGNQWWGSGGGQILLTKGNDVVISGNDITDGGGLNDGHGIELNNANGAVTDVTITGNRINDHNGAGIVLAAGSDRINITGNNIHDNGLDGIQMTGSDGNIVASNTIHNNGTATAGSDGIELLGDSNNNQITGNRITDTAGTGYAIDLPDADADDNYIANNTYSGTGAASINDSGTNTIFAGQLDSSNNLELQGGGAGIIELLDSTTITGDLTVGNGSNLLFVDTTNDLVEVAGQLEVVDGSLNTAFGGIGLIGNGLGNSEELNDNDWIDTNITVTANVVASPEDIGTVNTTAEQLTSTAADGTLTRTSSRPGANTWTFSIWLRGDAGGESVDLRIDSTDGSPATGTAEALTLTTEWKRYWVTQTVTDSPSVSAITAVIEMNNNAETIYAWGAQMTRSDQPGVYTSTTDGGGVGYAGPIQTAGAVVNGRFSLNGTLFFGNGDSNGSTSFGEAQLRTGSNDSFDIEVGSNFTVSQRTGEVALTVNPSAIVNGDGGTVLAVSAPTAATAQTAALTGQSIDLSTNLTVPDSAAGDQTGLSITLQDGGASATATGIDLLGTGDTGINFSGTYTNLLNGTNVTLTNAGALDLASTLTLGTLGATDNASFVCRNSSNILAGCNFTPLSSSLTDDTADALDIQEGTNNYININTTNGSELLSFGSTAINPSYSFLGSGTLTVDGGSIRQNVTTGPAHVGSLADGAGGAELDQATGVKIVGDYAYVAAQGATSDALEIIDISDPTAPVHLGALTDDGTNELDGAIDVDVVGKYAYVIGRADDGLEIIDISDPTTPTSVGELEDGAGGALLDEPISIKVVGSYAYITSRSENALEIVDISDPAAPVHAGSLVDNGSTLLNQPRGLDIAGNYAYVTSEFENGMQIIDISDPTNPTAVGSIADDGTTLLDDSRGIDVVGKYAYIVSNDENGLEIVDISDPTTPTHVGSIADGGSVELLGAMDVEVIGDYAYVASYTDDSIEVIDISDPTTPAYVTAIDDGGSAELLGPVRLDHVGNYLYVGSYDDDGFAIIDIGGAQFTSLEVGDIQSGNGQFAGDLRVVGSAYLDGAQIGAGGLLVQSNFAVGGSSVVFSNAAFASCGGLGTDSTGLVVCGTGEGTNEFTAVVGTSSAVGGNASDNVATADYTADGDTAAADDGDQVQINNAITTIGAAGGGTVLLLEGTYVIDDAIVLDSNVSLIGSGAGTVIFSAADGGVADSFSLIDATSESNVAIRDLTIDGNRANITNSTRNSIQMTSVGSGAGDSSVQGFTIENVVINDSENAGIEADGSHNSRIANVTIVDNGLSNGVSIINSSSYITVDNVRVSGAASDGVEVDDSTYITIANSHMEGNATGVSLTGTGGYHLVQNNIINSSTTYGINVTANDVVIEGNSINFNVDAGVRSTGNEITIRNNTFYDNEDGATEGTIHLSTSATKNQVIGNFIDDVTTSEQSYGITINGTSRYHYVADNVLDDTLGISESDTTIVYANQLTDSTDENSDLLLQAAGTGDILITSDTDITGTLTVSGNTTIQNTGYLAVQAAADFSTTDTTDDANLGAASLVRLTGASAQTINGITGGADGRILTIVNAAGQSATLANEAGTSTAANRIVTGTSSDLTLLAGASTTLIYDSTASRWRVVGGVAATGSGVTTLANIGSSPNADGATISGNTLTLQPASASFGGVVTTAAQTFAGAKTFIDDFDVNVGSGDVRLQISDTNTSDTYSLGVSTSIGHKFVLSSEEGTNRQALVFADGNSTDTIFGISRSTDSGSTWNELLTLDQDGNLSLGSINPAANFEIDKTGDAAILLQADSDDSGEDDNPYIGFSQDAGLHTAVLGLVGNAGVDPQANAFTGTIANSLLLGTTTADALQLGTNDAVNVTIASGGAVTLQNTADSSAALQVQNAAGTNLLTVDTTNDAVEVAGQLEVVGGSINSPFGGLGRFENWLTRSEEFDNGAWTLSGGVTVAADNTAAPDGQTTADRIVDDGTGGGYIEQTETAADATETWTFSVWLRDDNTTGNISIELDDNGSGSSTVVTIDPTSEWRRYVVTHTGTATATEMYARINHDTTASNAFFAWGAQLEEQSDAGAYISTTNTDADATSRGLVVNGGGDYISLNNDGTIRVDTSSGADAVIELQATAGTNDSYIDFNDGTTYYTLGLDDSDASDAFVLSANQALGTGNIARFTSSSVELLQNTSVTGTLTLGTLGATDNASFLCRNSSNILAGCNFTPLSSSLVDDTTDAFDIQEGTNNYININTTNSSENISFGNTNTDPSYNFLGNGNFTVGSDAVVFQNETDSVSAFQVQNASGTAILNVNTLDGTVNFGTDAIFGESVEISNGNISSPFGGFGEGGNLTLDSEGLGNSFRWTATNMTVTDNYTTSPNGVDTAERLVASEDNATLVSDNTFSLGDGTYTFSIWVKTDTGTEDFQLRIDSDGTPATGTAASFSATTDWVRYSVTETFTGGISSVSPTLVLDNNDGELHVWGASTVDGSNPEVYNRTNADNGGVGDVHGAFVNNRLSLDPDGDIYFGYGDVNNSSFLNANQWRTVSGSFSLQVESVFNVVSDDGENVLVVDPDILADGDAGTAIALAAVDAVTQAGAITGQSIDLNTNFTVPNTGGLDQTGLSISVLDGGSNTTATGIDLAGTGDTGINFSGTYTNLLNGTNVTLTNAGALTLGSSATVQGAINADGGIVVGASQSVTIAGDVIQEFAGTGLTVASNQLQVDGTYFNTNYIQNQSASDQTGDLRISGTARANTSVLTPLIDVAAAGTLSVGTGTATDINIGSGTGTVDIAGTTTVTGPSSAGYALEVSGTVTDGLLGSIANIGGTVASTGSDRMSGLLVDPDITVSVNSDIITAGIGSLPTTSTSNLDGGDLASLNAFAGGGVYTGSGTLRNAVAFGAQNSNQSTGTIGHSIGLQVLNPLNVGGGSITRSTGVSIVPQTAGDNNFNILIDSLGSSALGSYSIYNASTESNVFAGDLRIGDTTTATGALQVVGDEVRIGDGGTADTAAGDGDLYIEDALEVDGSIDLGDAAADTVTITGQVDSDVTFDEGADRTLSVEARASGADGRSLTVAAGAGGGSGNTAGGILNLNGGAAGFGNANGGNVVLSGGAGVGTGVLGQVSLAPTSFLAASAQAFTGSGNITQSNIDSFSTILISSDAAGYIASLTDPTITTAGRVIYVTNSGSFDMTLSVNGGGTGNEITLKPNATATMIWNGSDWTAAGASSSTDLQAAYDNTAASAGGAEIVLSASGTEGLTIRNDATTPISGALLEVQSGIGTNLFSVNNAGTEFVANGGAEDSTNFNTDWVAEGSATRTRETSASDIATGVASVQVDTTAAANDGVQNELASNPATSTAYQVSFTGKLASGTFTALDVQYTPDGGSTLVACTNYSTQTLITGDWTKVTCDIMTGATAVSDAELIIRQTDTTARTFHIDNLSMRLNSTAATPPNVQIGGGQFGGAVTLFTLDQASSPPVASGDSTYYGSMYYDTTTGRIQCYEADGWGACGAPPNNIITLTPEYAGAVLNGTGVGTMSADFCSDTSGVLQINASVCATDEARNYYEWTSPQATSQTYSILLTFQLPTTFDGFIDNSTITLDGYSTDISDADVEYEIFRVPSGGGAITECGSDTLVTTANTTWQTVEHNGNEATGCSFAASDRVIFKINMIARNNDSVYVSDINFTYTND